MITDTLYNILENVIGVPPDYFEIGSYNSIQWHYGELLLYACACMIAVLAVKFVCTLFINLLKK